MMTKPARMRWTLCCGALLLTAGAAFAADNNRGAIELSGGYIVPQNPALPKLDLNAAQQQKVRDVLGIKNSQIEFTLKTTKGAKDFTPAVDAKLPAAIKPSGIPSELTQPIPQLADYGYAKMKGQILIVNELTGKIAAIVAELPPQTTGQQ